MPPPAIPTPEVNSLWIGETLPPLAELCLRSYLANGVAFRLFCYRDYDNIPEGTIVCDASTIIPEDCIFYHKNGSLAPFSDWFRYVLLEERGGFWTDMDVICLTGKVPMEYPWFTWSRSETVTNGLIGFPPHHPVMQFMRLLAEDPSAPVPWDTPNDQKAKEKLRISVTDVVLRRQTSTWGWAGPVAFTKALQWYKILDQAASSSSVVPYPYTSWKKYYDGSLVMEDFDTTKTWGIHVFGEMLRLEPDAMNRLHPESVISCFFNKYNISVPPQQTTLPPVLSKQKVNILVGICSWMGAREKRDAVRRTWLQYPQPGVECLFFVGGDKPLSEEEQKDTVHLDVPDGYHELPAKVFAFFRYALEHYDFDWLFKCDDDTYLKLSRLPELALPGYDLIGDVMIDTRQAPSGGAGYFLSRGMVEKIVTQLSLPSLGAEDLIVGRLAFQLGGKSLATGRLYMNNVYYPDENNDMVSAHWCSPAILDAIHTFNYEEPDTVYSGKHPHWKDDVLFFANGTFRRRSTSCYGRWSLGEHGELRLAWQIWAEEQLILREGDYVGSTTILSPHAGVPTLYDLMNSGSSENASSFASSERLFIHLGCGRRRLSHWLNLDMPHYDISQPLPWDDCEVDAYFIEHAIEQLDAGQSYRFFKEAHRTLKLGGILRLSLTDIREFCQQQTPALRQYMRVKNEIQCSSTSGALQALIKANGCRSFWTKESIVCVLEDLGFSVMVYEAGLSEKAHLQGLERRNDRDENPFDYMGTICVEAQKPGRTISTVMKYQRNQRQSSAHYITPRFQPDHRTGNRMFQVAAVYAHALRHGLECCIPWRYSPEISELFDWLGEDAAPCPNGGYDAPITYREPTFSYTRIPASVTNGALEGFFQSEKYFSDAEREVRTMFSALTAPRRQGVAGVHVRMGDYLQRTDMYHSPDADFLSEALKRLSDDICELVIFSDMPERARLLVASLPEARRFSIKVDGHDTLGALRELTAMQELILSCSSFSWWGAYLGDQDRVFIQKHWFVGNIYEDRDIYRDKWIKI